MLLYTPKHISKVLASLGIALGLLLPAPVVGALAYGDGNYGQCQYGQNCPPASNSTTNNSSGSGATGSGQAATPTDQTGGAVLLNDFDSYFQTAGKTLDLAAAQVVYFEVDVPNATAGGVSKEKHSITIKEVGDNYVVLVIASEPQTVKLYVGQTGEYDVTSDGKNDIAITLNSIVDKKANLTFKQLGTTTKKTTTTVAATPAPATKNWWPIIIYSLMTLVGIGLLIWLITRKKRSKN